MSDGLADEPNKILLYEAGSLLHKFILETLTIEFTRIGGSPTGAGNVNPLFGATSALRHFFCRTTNVIDRTLDNGSNWVSTTPVYATATATGFNRIQNVDFCVTWSGAQMAIASITDSSTVWDNEVSNTDTGGHNVAYAQIGNVTATSFDAYVITQNGTSFRVWKMTTVYASPQPGSGIPPSGRLNYAAAEQAVVKFYDNLKAVAICFPSGDSTVSDVTLWYFVGKGWVEDSRHWRMVIPLAVNDLATKIYAWDADAGIIREIDVDLLYTDDGNAIVPRIDTGFISGTDRDVEARWAWLGFVTSETVEAQVAASVGDDTPTDLFTMYTNRDERLRLLGRRVRFVIDFTSRSFFRLSEIALRYLPFRSFRPRG
jgi:hypothetical protein